MSEELTVEVVNKKTGEIVLEGTPEDLLVAASDAAKALERVISLNERPPLMFNGKRYLEFHHWMTIGKFYHATVKTMSSEPVEIDGVKGFKARAEVIDEKTGLVVGGAEAYCFRDEPNWTKKPLFQLASMAQTRAASKALANKFRFVAIVAGYEGTPSEEMTNETTQKQVAMPKAKEVPEARGSDLVGPGVDTVGGSPDKPGTKSKFFARLHAAAREKEVTAEAMKQMMAQLFHKEHSRDLTDPECAKLIKIIENMQ